MLEVCLLGTGGMLPLPYRFLTSLLCKADGSQLLIDCGEATQIAIKKNEYSTNPIDFILITHFHADHISGLVGLLLSIGNSDRKKEIIIAGPTGIQKVVESLLIIAPKLPFKINYIEFNDDHGETHLGPYRIEYFSLKHRIKCLGYNIYLDRLPLFLKDKAEENKVPIKYWNKLQHGIDNIKDEKTGKIYTRDMVMGDERKGIKISYFTDTRPCQNILDYTKNADLMICEGMYGEDGKIENAKKYLHMTMEEAGEIGAKNKPKDMWLTHFSPSEVAPQNYEKNLKKIYDKIKIYKDGNIKIFNFED